MWLDQIEEYGRERRRSNRQGIEKSGENGYNLHRNHTPTLERLKGAVEGEYKICISYPWVHT